MSIVFGALASVLDEYEGFSWCLLCTGGGTGVGVFFIGSDDVLQSLMNYGVNESWGVLVLMSPQQITVAKLSFTLACVSNNKFVLANNN